MTDSLGAFLDPVASLLGGVRGCITKDRLNQDLVSLVRDCTRRAE